MAGMYGQMEVVKVSGLDGRLSGRSSGLLKIIGLDDASYHRTERRSQFFTYEHTCMALYVANNVVHYCVIAPPYLR